MFLSLLGVCSHSEQCPSVRPSAAGLLLQFVLGGALKSERSVCFPTEFMVSACHSYLVLAFLSGHVPFPSCCLS